VVADRSPEHDNLIERTLIPDFVNEPANDRLVLFRHTGPRCWGAMAHDAELDIMFR